MKGAFVFMLVATAMVSHPAVAQTGIRCADPIKWKNIGERIDVMHNLNTRTEVAQPAFIQWTDPANKRAEASVSAAAKFVACATKAIDLTLSAEYLWNTASDERKNAWRSLAELEWQNIDYVRGGNDHSPVFTLQAGFKDDNEGGTEALQGSALYTHVFRNAKAPLPNATWSLGPVDLTYSPVVGITYEAVRNRDPVADDGSIVRLVGQVDASIYPFAVKLERHLEIGATYAFRWDVRDGTDERDDDHPYFRAAVNLFLFQDDQKSAGLSVAFVDGEDPTRGFSNSQFWQLGATLRIK